MEAMITQMTVMTTLTAVTTAQPNPRVRSCPSESDLGEILSHGQTRSTVWQADTATFSCALIYRTFLHDVLYLTQYTKPVEGKEDFASSAALQVVVVVKCEMAESVRPPLYERMVENWR